VTEAPRGLGLGPALRRHFGGRQNALASAIALFPLFIAYQAGILAGARGHNGADFVTSTLIALCAHDLGLYLLVLVGLSAAYVGVLAVLRRRRSAHARLFGPMLLESFLYAFFMGGVIQILIVRLDRLVPILAIAARGPLDVVVISAGAGFHEELVFRAGLLAALIRLLGAAPVPLARTTGPLLALLLSSVAFAAVHHLGPGAEPVTTLALVYRTLAGMLFGLIYLYRGLGVAAWTHALYDVLVLTFR
jgi:membrane protease YdiL (CAAX protease family)